MSGVGQTEDGVEASTSGIMETTMMEGEEYFNPDDTGTWTQKEMSDQLCRICAKPNQYLIPIFEGEGIEHQLEPKIRKHLPIEVSESDDLPVQVCYQCASTLIAWNDLVIACVEADQKLRQIHVQEEEDDKGVEFYDEPIIDSDDEEESVQPSTSLDTAAPDMQSDTTSHPKRSPSKAKKPKLKMTLVKSPTAGPSGLKSPAKKLIAAKSQDSAVTETSERLLKASRLVSLQSRVDGAVTSDHNKLQHLKCHELQLSCMTSSLVTTRFESNCTDVMKYNETGSYQENMIEVQDQDTESVRSIYECDYCGKIIMRKENLISHIRIHTGECPYTCHICGKSFRQSKGIRRHIKEFHERIRNFPCLICGTAFLNKRTLGDHMTIHTGKRDFVCDVCGKTYKTKTGVNHHKIYHTSVFPFPCVYCEKEFRTRSALSLHLPRHTKEKPHICSVCGKCFGVKNDLTRHSLVHMSNNMFTCGVCGHTFKQRRYLRMHEKSHYK